MLKYINLPKEFKVNKNFEIIGTVCTLYYIPTVYLYVYFLILSSAKISLR